MNNSEVSKKDLLLKGAFVLFLANGFDGVSIDDVLNTTISESGMTMSKALIFHHFKNKDQLFKAAVDKYIFDPLAERPDISVQIATQDYPLRTFIAIYLEKIQERMQKALGVEGRTLLSSRNYFRIFISLKDHYPDSEEKISEYYRHEYDLWDATLSIALQANEIDPDTDIKQIAYLFINVYHGLSFKQSLLEGLTVEALEKQWLWIYDQIRIKG